MRRTLLSLALLAIGISSFAQNNIIDVRPANDPSGKILTMEETILSRDLAPKNLYCRWISDNEIAMLKDGNFVVFDINTRLEKPYRPTRTTEVIISDGKSLYHKTQAGDTIPVAVSKDPDITYGQFVSRNEFGIEDGIFWAPDSSKVAF